MRRVFVQTLQPSGRWVSSSVARSRLAPQVFAQPVQVQLRVRDAAQKRQQPIRIPPCPEAPGRLDKGVQGLQEGEPAGTTVHG